MQWEARLNVNAGARGVFEEIPGKSMCGALYLPLRGLSIGVILNGSDGSSVLALEEPIAHRKN